MTSKAKLDLTDVTGDGRVRIKVGPTTPDTIRMLTAALDLGVIPNTYVTDGRPTFVEAVSGTAVATVSPDEDSLLPVVSTTITPALMQRLLADHAFPFKNVKAKGSDEWEEVETTPTGAALGAVLASKTWQGMQPLLGIVGAPVLRPDGTLLQDPGYDEATGLYLASKVPLDPVPERPTPAQVQAARDFLFNRFLGDFLWVSEADKANHIGLMVTPILRPYTRCLTPFAIVTATMPASGKTILTASVGMLYGQRVLSWTHSDEELRKSITSVLADQAGCIVFDNLAEGSVIDSPILARLITERTWADRLLGKNTTAAIPNDRLWLATGNALNVGGDMASRTVLIRLDPNMPNPEQRVGFAIPHLDQWILDPANQRQVLWHLLVLIVDWTAAGAPRAKGVAMRQFTTWAEAVGGFLQHHGVPGFLANAGSVLDVDEAAAEWSALLTRWRALHGDQALTASDLCNSAILIPGDFGQPARDRWEGTFPTDSRSNPLRPIPLGKRLRGQVGRWRGNHVLRKGKDEKRNMAIYWVEKK